MPSVSAKAAPTSRGGTKRVVIVVYPGVTLLDAAGPAQVFASANDVFGMTEAMPRYRVVLASPAGREIQTDTGISLGTVSLRQASAKPIDTLIVAGGAGVFDALDEKKLINWIKLRHENCRRVASTCMGAFLTAEAGLLDGQVVTTHWRRTEELQRRHPSLRVQRDPLFIRNGKMWSSAGVTAGIDLALAMVEEDHGHDTAMQVAQSLVVYFKRPGGQSQFSNVLAAQKEDSGGTFSELHAWISGNLQFELDVETLARRAGMSPRTFFRLYKENTGITPAKYVEMLRVDTAKRLLEQGTMRLARIAKQTGLVDEQRMRRAFLRHVGVSPSEYRMKFGTGAKR
jgi:transcriptional regulator GlxA family with amidase domain